MDEQSEPQVNEFLLKTVKTLCLPCGHHRKSQQNQ